MKLQVILICLCGVSVHGVVRGNKVDDWQNEQVIGRNKLAPHTDCHIPYASYVQALSLKEARSPYYKLLNGHLP